MTTLDASTLGNSIEVSLDKLHAWAYQKPSVARLARLTRVLLFSAFMPTGLIKLLGLPFASPAVGPEIFGFFDAMHKTGIYWRFIGLSQIAAAILLLADSTRGLGSLMYLCILSNVTILTFALPFGGTRLVTSLMMLAVLLLVCLEYHRWRSLLPWCSGLPYSPPDRPSTWPAETITLAALMVVATLAGLSSRSLLPGATPFSNQALINSVPIVVLLYGVATGVGWIRDRHVHS